MERIIDKETAARQAIRALEDLELFRNERFERILKYAKPAEPVLVQRLDRTNDFYYLIPTDVPFRLEVEFGHTAYLQGVSKDFQDDSCKLQSFGELNF